MTYDAFISYSHAADGTLAPSLQQALQRFAKPWHRRRALRVFRDDTGLSTNPHLWGAIERALDESDWFVLLASPDAAASTWVNRELAHWLATKSADRVLPVVTDGTWTWDAARGDFAPDATAVPDALRGEFADEPRHLDLRWARTDAEQDLRNARFRSAVADLAAPMHGIPKDDLDSEDVRLHRRARRLARGAASTLALLLVISVVAAGYASVQRRDAITQRNRARDQELRAQARGLAAQSYAVIDVKRDLSLLLAVQAHRTYDLLETRGALLAALTESPRLARVDHRIGTDVTAAAVSSDGSTLVVGHQDGRVRVWDLRAGSPRGDAVPAHGGAVTDVAVSADGSHAASVGAGRGGDRDAGPVLRIVDGRRGVLLDWPRGATAELVGNTSVAFAARGSVFFTIGGDLRRWDAASPDPVPQVVGGGPATHGAVSGDGRVVVVAAFDGVRMLDTVSGTSRFVPALLATTVAVNAGGDLVAVGNRTGQVSLVDVAAGAIRWTVGIHTARVRSLAFSAGGSLVASGGDDGAVVLSRVTDGAPFGQPQRGVGAAILELAFAGGDRQMYTVARDTFAAFDLDRVALGRRIVLTPQGGAGDELVNDGITAIASTAGTIATAGERLHVWKAGGAPGPAVPGWRQDRFGRTTHELAMSRDGATIAIGRGGSIELWDGRTRERVRAVEVTGDEVDEVRSVAVSSDGRRVAFGLSGSGNGLRGGVIDASSGSLQHRFTFPARTVQALAFSPDDRMLVTASGDGVVRFWDAPPGRPVQTRGEPLALGVVEDLAFSPDGRTLAAVTADGTLVLVDPARGAAYDAPLVDPTGPLVRVAFSPDGRTIATMSRGGSFGLWDAARRQVIGLPVVAHEEDVTTVENLDDAPLPDLAFVDATTLVTSSVDGSVTLWDLDDDAWVRAACALAARNLTEREWARWVGGPYQRTCTAG